MMTDQELFALAAKGARAEWAGSPGLRAEFETAEQYVAHLGAVFTGNAVAARAGFEKEWRAKADLQRQYVTAESYASLRCAEMRGLVRRLAN